MKTFNGYEVVDAKARQDIASHNTRITEVEKFFEAADTNGVIDKLAEVQKYIEDDAEAAASLVKSIADVDAKIDAIHIPEKVSELENDKGYLTEHQSLEGKADKEHTHPQYLTEHQSLANYYTKAQTDSAIGEAVGSIKIPEPDLTPYAKVADMPTKVSQLENDANYLTEHQSLDGYATEQYVDDAIADIDIPETDLSNYYTKTQVDNKLEIVDDSYFFDFSTAPTLANPATATAEMVEFVEQLRDGKDACAQIRDSHDDIYYPAIISKRYSSNGVYIVYLTKVAGNINLLRDNQCWEWDTICLQHDGTECVYFKGGNNSYEFVSKQYVDEAVKNAGGSNVDLTGYATEDYVDTAISNIDIPDCTMQVIDVTGASTTNQAVDGSILQKIINREHPLFCLKDGTTIYYPAYYAAGTTNVNMTLPAIYDYNASPAASEISSTEYKFTSTSGQWYVTKYTYKHDLD